MIRKTESQQKLNLKRYFPAFIIWFLLLAILRSLGDFSLDSTEKVFWGITEEDWKEFGGTLKTITVQLLIIALAAIGLNTRFANLKKLGSKAFLSRLLCCFDSGDSELLFDRGDQPMRFG